MEDSLVRVFSALNDICSRLDKIDSDVSRLTQHKAPDRFVPVQEAVRHLHCGRDWLVRQIKAGVLRPGIDFIDRTSTTSSRKRYLVNPVSALRWLNGAQVVAVKTKSRAILPDSNLIAPEIPVVAR